MLFLSTGDDTLLLNVH